MRLRRLAIGASAAIGLIVNSSLLLPTMFAAGGDYRPRVDTELRGGVVFAEQQTCDSASDNTNRTRDQGGSIQGQVFQLVGRSRQPLDRVSVSVQRLGFASGTMRSVKYERTAVTNMQGHYQVKDLPTGEYYVSAVMNSAGSFTDNPRDRSLKADVTGFGPTFYPGTISFAEAHRVVVYQGLDISEIDIPVERKRLARLSGRMIGTHPELMDGAYVSVSPAASIGRVGLSGFMGVSRVTSDGEFMIERVPPGEYRLQGRSIPLAAVQEIASTGSSAPLTASADGEFGSLPVTVDGMDMMNLQLTLRRGGRVAGAVQMDGRPFGAGGPRFRIRAEPTDAESFSAGNSDAAIGEDGAFEIRGLAGVFVLRLSGGTRSATLVRVEMDGQDVTDTGGAINPGEEITGIKVILTSRPTEVTGHVTRPTQTPFPACWVIVFSSESQRWLWPATRYVAAARVGPAGTFHVQGLPPGTYLAAVVAGIEEGDWLDPVYLRALARQARSIELKEGERKTIDFSPPSK